MGAPKGQSVITIENRADVRENREGEREEEGERAEKVFSRASERGLINYGRRDVAAMDRLRMSRAEISTALQRARGSRGRIFVSGWRRGIFRKRERAL